MQISMQSVVLLFFFIYLKFRLKVWYDLNKSHKICFQIDTRNQNNIGINQHYKGIFLFSSPTHRSDAGSSNQQHPNNSTTPTNMMSSSTGSGAQTPSGGNTLEQPSRMFGDTLHLHRSSNNATKQVDALDFFRLLI